MSTATNNYLSIPGGKERLQKISDITRANKDTMFYQRNYSKGGYIEIGTFKRAIAVTYVDEDTNEEHKAVEYVFSKDPDQTFNEHIGIYYLEKKKGGNKKNMSVKKNIKKMRKSRKSRK